jgi:copper chaperone CopZ
MRAVETAILEVRGMSCGGCERSVRLAVEELPGIDHVVPEHIADEVEVTYDPAAVTLDQIRAAISEAGFTAP